MSDYLSRADLERRLAELLHEYDVGDECGTEFPCAGVTGTPQERLATEVVDWLVEGRRFSTGRRNFPSGGWEHEPARKTTAVTPRETAAARSLLALDDALGRDHDPAVELIANARRRNPEVAFRNSYGQVTEPITSGPSPRLIGHAHLSECSLCGALVGQTEPHARFHERAAR